MKSTPDMDKPSKSTNERSVFDRVIRIVQPTVDASFSPAPTQIASRLWALDRRLRMPGGAILPTRTTIIVLSDGGLLVVSPPSVQAGGLKALDTIGRVRHVLVPNSYHHLNAVGFMALYPEASFWAAPALFSRVPGLPPGIEVEEPAPAAWRDAVEVAILRPTQEVSEVALFHRETRTLVLTDLAFNMVRFSGTTQRLLWRLSGVPASFGPSRTARMLLLRDTSSATPFLERVAAWPFERIVVAHGDAVEVDARGTFRRAFAAYLPG